MFMPDGVLPAIGNLVQRFGRSEQQGSIREESAEELRDQRESAAATGGTP